MKSVNSVAKNRSSDPSARNKTRYNEFVKRIFGRRGLIGRPSPLTPLQNAAAGRAGHSSSSPGGVEAKKTFEFQDRISGGSPLTIPAAAPE
jgi:hypothetical protein